MSKSRALEATFETLARARRDPTAEASLREITKALRGRSPHAAAKAAQIIGEAELGGLVPELLTAFERFSQDPVKADGGCVAKTAIAEALYRIGTEAADIFLRGIRYRQLEPAYGGPVDTASGLRGVCGFGLVRIAHPDALIELATLLADSEANARQQAAEALAYSENPAVVPLLRFKVLTGDPEPSVLTECFTALLKVAPGPSLAFVARFLDDQRDEVAEAAALALGMARRADAFPILLAWWKRIADPSLRSTAMLAMALLRHDEAVAFLIELVATAPGPTARGALDALAIFRDNEILVARVERARAGRTDVL